MIIMACCFRGVAIQSRDAVTRSSRLLDLWQEYRNRLQSARSSVFTLRLIDELISYPVTTYMQAARLLKVTPRAARLNVEKQVEAGILTEITGRQRNRIYAAQEIIDILERQEVETMQQ